MHRKVLLAALVLSILACDRKTSAPDQPSKPPAAILRSTAALVDLTSQSSLAPVRAAFNAHKGEARFLTLLSPT